MTVAKPRQGKARLWHSTSNEVLKVVAMLLSLYKVIIVGRNLSWAPVSMRVYKVYEKSVWEFLLVQFEICVIANWHWFDYHRKALIQLVFNVLI